MVTYKSIFVFDKFEFTFACDCHYAILNLNIVTDSIQLIY